MRTDYFADVADLSKNQGKMGKAGKIQENLSVNNGLDNSGCLTQPKSSWVRWVRPDSETIETSEVLTHLTHAGKGRVRRGNDEKASNNNDLSSALPNLPNLPKKTGEFATEGSGIGAEPLPADRRCGQCAHFSPSPYEPPLGDYSMHERIYRANSQPTLFGCGEFLWGGKP